MRGVVGCLAYTTGMGVPIPKINPLHAPSRRTQIKARARVLRPNVRRDTWSRDGFRCRACGKLLPLHSDSPFTVAHIHERDGGTKRAAESVDVTLRSTITLCAKDHAAVEQYKLHITVVDEAQGFNGPVRFTGRVANGDRVRDMESRPTLTPMEARST